MAAGNVPSSSSGDGYSTSESTSVNLERSFVHSYTDEQPDPYRPGTPRASAGMPGSTGWST